MSPRFLLGRENVPCVAEVVNRSLKAHCTDFTVFIHWVRTFLCKAETCVRNNCYSTRHFPLERGVRQGDPLPACLFIIVLQTLFIQALFTVYRTGFCSVSKVAPVQCEQELIFCCGAEIVPERSQCEQKPYPHHHT